MGKLSGKVAIVTGASKGIGASIARRFASEGASVVVNYASGREDAERVVSAITKEGGQAVAVQGSVADKADVARLIAETRRQYGTLDVLVNNAGVFEFAALEAVTEAEFHREFNINVLGPILTTQAALGLFGEHGGSVINVSSVVSLSPPPNSVVYSATKGALDTITRALAVELAPRKIRVNTLAPGGVETEGSHRVGMIGSDMEKHIVAATPLGRIGQPDDIARVAVFLAAADSAWVTGDRISVAGGYR
jgi:3-oxoacyl-[acyl-carrier protein] reductase